MEVWVFYSAAVCGRVLTVSLARSGAFVWLLIGACLLGAAGATVVGGSEHDAEHENPDEVREDGNLTAVQRWLGGEMTEIQLNCAENLSAVDSAACDRLDEEYPDYLSEYVSVERERTGDDETARQYEEAGEQQRQLVEERAEYEEAYQEYQQAREEGDDQRARRLARELQNRSGRITELGDAQIQTYRQLEQRTGRDYDRGINATAAVVAETRNTTRQVERDVFTPTELTATAESGSARFTSPVTISGALTDENGTRLADQPVALVVDGRTVATAETDASGSYEADYRPVATETGPTTVNAVYRPSRGAAYLGSNATTEVDVGSVEPSASVGTDVEEVAFGDPVPAEVSVSVDGEAAESVPVALFLGDERIAETRTGEDGSVILNGTVPATVPDGERELRVRVSREGTALEPIEETRSVTVEETETELTIEGFLDGDELVLSGRLTTVDGRAVPDQRVGINVDAEVRETTTTNDLGQYEVRVPEATGGNDEWAVSADYDESDTNLAPTATSRTLQAEDFDTANGTAAGAIDEFIDEVRTLLSTRERQLAAAAAAALLLLVAVPLLYRRLRDEETASDEFGGFATTDEGDGVSGDDERPSAEAVGAAAPEEPSSPAPAPAPASDPLELARQRLLEGAPSDAVRLGYGAVRDELLQRTGSEKQDTRTHWEFYRDTAPKLPESRAAALESLTEAYERAAFAPAGVTERTAESAVEAAAECLEDSSVTDGGTDSGE